jgi:hypothetical protein
MLIQDAPEHFIAEAVEDLIALREQRVFRACNELVWRGVRREFPNQDRLAAPQRACELIALSIGAVNERMRQVVSRRSSLHWIWMLRRLPTSVFEGTLATTLGYDQTLAEAATGVALESNDATVAPDLVVTFPLDQAVLNDLADLCSLVRFASDV